MNDGDFTNALDDFYKGCKMEVVEACESYDFLYYRGAPIKCSPPSPYKKESNNRRTLRIKPLQREKGK